MVSRAVALFCLGLILASCASFREESKELFQKQSQLKYELVEVVKMAEDRGDMRTVEILERAEIELSDTCGSLQRNGYSRLIRRVVTFWQKFFVVLWHDRCKAKVEEVEKLLHKLKPTISQEKEKPSVP